MAPGINYSKEKKKPWKTRVERDIIMHKDIKEVGLQGGKVIGDKLILTFIYYWHTIVNYWTVCNI